MTKPTHLILDKKFKLDRVAQKQGENNRFATHAVSIDCARNRAVVTDGRILAVVPCKVEADDPLAVDELVSIEALKAARKAAGRSSELALDLDVQGAHVTDAKTGSTQTFVKPNGEFPKYDLVLEGVETGSLSITLNAELLHKLADALGNKNVKLEFSKGKDTPLCPKSPVRVTPIGYDTSDAGIKPVGVIMPLAPLK